MNIQESIGELPETCRAVIKRKDGHIVGVRVLTDDERIASLMAFLELAEIAGYTITPLTRKTRYNIGAGLNTRHHFLNTAAPPELTMAQHSFIRVSGGSLIPATPDTQRWLTERVKPVLLCMQISNRRVIPRFIVNFLTSQHGL